MDFSKVLTVAIFSQLFWKKIHYSTRYIYTRSEQFFFAHETTCLKPFAK